MYGKIRGYLLCHDANVCRPSSAAREAYICWLVRADWRERLTRVENSMRATLRTFQLAGSALLTLIRARKWEGQELTWEKGKLERQS